jgi:hypothetical protein
MLKYGTTTILKWDLKKQDVYVECIHLALHGVFMVNSCVPFMPGSSSQAE